MRKVNPQDLNLGGEGNIPSSQPPNLHTIHKEVLRRKEVKGSKEDIKTILYSCTCDDYYQRKEQHYMLWIMAITKSELL